MKFTWGLVLLSLFASSSFAFDCVEKRDRFDNTQIQIIASGSGCLFSIHNTNVYADLIYRDFLFDQEGLFMIFSSFGPGDESETTGAREYYFFPRTQNEYKYSYDAQNKRLTVLHPSGKEIVFNTVKTLPVSMTGTQLAISGDIKPDNKGGISVTSNKGLYLDLGFNMGQSPSQSPSTKVQFKNSSGQSCAVLNREIFKYDQYGDVFFKYKTDAGLKTFLTGRCQGFGTEL